MKTLRELVERELDEQEETEADIEKITVGPLRHSEHPETAYVDGLAGLEEYEGYSGYGGQRFPPVYVWTESRVYLKGHYDGSEWITSVPRSPKDDESPEPIGGG